MAWETIQRLSAPSSDILDFTGLSLGGYQRLRLFVDGLTVGTDDVQVLLRLGTAGTLRTSGYRYYAALGSSSSSTTSINQNTPASGTSVPLTGTAAAWGVGNAANEGFSTRIEISHLGSTLYKHVEHNGTIVGPSGASFLIRGRGMLEQTGAITDVRVLLSAGTMPTGAALLQGLVI